MAPRAPSLLRKAPGDIDVSDPDEQHQVAPEPESDGAHGVIVIGSGFGGAVASCRLMQAGFDVLLLERGRRYGPTDFPPLPADSALLPDLQRWTWGDAQGLWDIVDLEELVSVQAAAFGGGSLIYANVQLEPPASVFDARWPAAYQVPGALDEFFALGRYMLDAAPIDTHAIYGDIVKVDQLRKVMGGLGRAGEFFLPPLAINRGDRTTSIGGIPQKACTGCGACCSGCPETAKNTLDYNYLALAERRGAKVRTLCEVTEIRSRNTDGTPGRDGWFVDYVDHVSGKTHHALGKHVFVCAGSVHSTRLLARARLKSVQSRVGVGYFPGGDSLGMVYATRNAQYPSFGPTITTTTVHWEDPKKALYFMLQDGGYAPELARLVGILRAPAWAGRNRLTIKDSDGETKIAVVAGSTQVDAARKQRATPNAIAMPSLVDDIARAIAAGNLERAVPERLVEDWSVVTSHLTDALLLKPVVASVIDGAMAKFIATFWLTSWLPQDGGVVRLLHRIGRRIVKFFFGTDEGLARRAFGSALRGGDLTRDAWAEKVLGYDASGAESRLMLLGMGRDAASGTLVYFRDTDRLVADLDLVDLAPGYTREEQLMGDVARSLGGELRTNPAWAFLGKPITVHNQGGCPMSDHRDDGVTTPDGQVWGVEGLYVIDGASLCTSVGVNPSGTITAVAERNVLTFIRTHGQYAAWPEGDPSDGAREYEQHRKDSKTWGKDKNWTVTPPGPPPQPETFKSKPLGVEFDEKLDGFYTETTTPPGSNDDKFLELETEGRPTSRLALRLTLAATDLNVFFEDPEHTMVVQPGTKTLKVAVTLHLPGNPNPLPKEYEVTDGLAQIFAPRFKPYGIDPEAKGGRRLRAQERLAGRRYGTRLLRPGGAVAAALEPRFFNYLLHFEGDGKQWTLFGYKRVRDNPAMDAWRDTSTLFVTLLEGHLSLFEARTAPKCRGAGAVHTELSDFLFEQLHGLRVTGAEDNPMRAAWATTSFAAFFFGSLLRVYAPGMTTLVGALAGKQRASAVSEPHRPPWRGAPR